jgi:hypothetical protein
MTTKQPGDSEAAKAQALSDQDLDQVCGGVTGSAAPNGGRTADIAGSASPNGGVTGSAQPNGGIIQSVHGSASPNGGKSTMK